LRKRDYRERRTTVRERDLESDKIMRGGGEKSKKQHLERLTPEKAWEKRVYRGGGKTGKAKRHPREKKRGAQTF